MKIIYAISPTYLNSLFKEAVKYDFKLQGYGNVTNAIKGLLKTNISDILGFAYVNTMLPENLEPLKQFIDLCGMISECEPVPKKFIFALQDMEDFEKIFDHDYGNLDFSYIPNIEVFTDIEINRGIFGSILKHNYNPYSSITIGKKENKLDVNSIELTKNDLLKLHDDFPKLEYNHAINPYFLKIFDEFHLLDSLKSTIEYDEVYQDYLIYNKLFAKLREIYLKIGYVRGLLNNLKSNIESSANIGNLDDKIQIYKNLLDQLVEKLNTLDDSLNEPAADIYIFTKSVIYILKEELLKVQRFLYESPVFKLKC